MLAVLILAAGKGTRMKSDLPKVLHPLGGRPLIEHVVSAAEALSPTRILVIVGHGRDTVYKQLNDNHLEFVVQDPQLGTGHAVQQAIPKLNDFDGSVVILSGDAPLIKSSTLRQLVQKHESAGAAVTVLSALSPDPTNYGRIIRDAKGSFERIIEERDATASEKAVREVNSGIYCFAATPLIDALRELRPDNAKGEYYLTDTISILKGHGMTTQALDIAEFYEVRGINTPEELADAELRLATKAINSALDFSGKSS